MSAIYALGIVLLCLMILVGGKQGWRSFLSSVSYTHLDNQFMKVSRFKLVVMSRIIQFVVTIISIQKYRKKEKSNLWKWLKFSISCKL